MTHTPRIALRQIEMDKRDFSLLNFSANIQGQASRRSKTRAAMIMFEFHELVNCPAWQRLRR
jgi:hypothetical protein